MAYQTGWIREISRSGWTAFKLCWREKDVNGRWTEKTRTLPREMNGKPVVKKDAQQSLGSILREVNSRQGQADTRITGVTFSTFLADKWADYVERNKLRQSTLDGYTSMLGQWITPHFGA